MEPLLAWAESELRDLPWRRTRDPWAVLVSEVMLQQTQVSRVIDRWTEFLHRFPTAAACAAAPVAETIKLWHGLGFNRRAVNLWKAASETVDRFGGQLPNDLAALMSLPGVGPYTARAVLVFAFEQPVGVVDTNVGRLLARWAGSPFTPKQAQLAADDLVPDGQAWRWNQALFDFANAVCTKREPSCGECPLRKACAWAGRGHDPAIESAGVSKPQSKFEGSRRQVRGRLLASLRSGAVARTDLMTFARAGDHLPDMESVVADLVEDGLIVDRGSVLELPGS